MPRCPNGEKAARREEIGLTFWGCAISGPKITTVLRVEAWRLDAPVTAQ